MEPRFHLRCLGEPILLGPDGQPVRFKVRKHLALLVYLTVESRARHRREHLADLLWANLPESDGRHSLATALSTLRARFGREIVESSRDDLRWAYTRLDVDLDRLAAGDVLGNDFLAPLEVAGFLDGFEVPGAAEFMLWRERQRARWLPLVRDALVLLIDRCRRTGDFRQIEHLADRMLRLDDLSEEAIRAKMEARAFAGDRLTALKIFESWAERLDEELGAAPSALLDGMALRLRKRGWERSPTSGIPSVRTEQWKDRAFVGRAIEYRTLYEGWERTQRGEAGHAVVLGESGIGKSTLVERLATAAGLEGAAVSRVQCYDLEREIPYAAVSGLVRGLLDRPGASAAPPEALAELARTVSEVRRRFPNIPAAPESEGETARIRLTEAMHQLVASVADEHPVILVVDDHHLADDASLAVLHLVMRRAVGQQIMVVLVARPSEMGASPQAVRLRESLPRLGVTSVELPPMTEPECAELLGSLIPAAEPQPSGAARRALLRAARGYPMVLELLCRDWQQQGERSLALSLEAMTVDPATPGAPAEAYRQLLDRIVLGLDPSTRNVLNLGAILGHRLNDVAMYGLVDLTVGQTMTGMSRLAELRVLRDGGNGLEFVNELIRAHAYMSVPSTMRRVLHAHIADRLIEADSRGDSVPGLEVAWHCIRCGRPEAATPYLLRGARQAMQRGAPHEAERGLITGLDSLGARRAEGVILLAEALQEQGQWSASLSVLEDSSVTCNATAQAVGKALRVIAQDSLCQLVTGDMREQLAVLTTTIRDHAEAEVIAATARAAAALAMSLREPSLAVSVLAALDRSRAVEFHGFHAEWVALANAQLLYLSQRRVVARDRLLAIVTDLESNGVASAVVGQLQIGLGSIRCGLGDYVGAVAPFEKAYRVAERLENETRRTAAAANLALCYGRLGEYQKQLDWAKLAASQWKHAPRTYTDVLRDYSSALAYAMTNQRDESLSALSRLLAPLAIGIPDWAIQAQHFYAADVNLLLGRNKDAREAASRALGLPPRLLSPAFAGPYARWRALLGSENGATADAEAEIGRMRDGLDEYDAIDQVQILAGWAQIKSQRISRRLPYSHHRNLSERLAILPPAVSQQLDRLSKSAQ